jgi:hypothetical protein
VQVRLRDWRRLRGRRKQGIQAPVLALQRLLRPVLGLVPVLAEVRMRLLRLAALGICCSTRPGWCRST